MLLLWAHLWVREPYKEWALNERSLAFSSSNVPYNSATLTLISLSLGFLICQIKIILTITHEKRNETI